MKQKMVFTPKKRQNEIKIMVIICFILGLLSLLIAYGVSSAIDKTNEQTNIINENIPEITKLIKSLKSEREIHSFMIEILTTSELETLSKRWCILKKLSSGSTQREIAKEFNVSLCKVTRGAKILKNKNAITTKHLTEGIKNGK